MQSVERGVFFFTTDGRLLVRPADTGKIREATEDDRRAAARAVWPFHRGMWRRWGGGEENPASG
jgi:hypothetical protein